MVSQVVNFSKYETQLQYKEKYNIAIDVECKNLIGVEIRNLYDVEVINKIENLLQNSGCKFFRNKDNCLIVSYYNEFRNLPFIFDNEAEVCGTISDSIENYLRYGNQSYQFGGRDFIFNRPYIMGILNITPDSFSDGGKYFSTDKAIDIAIKMLHDGIDIIDIGGESTRPGSESISGDEELRRIVPVIESILKEFPDAVISVDTYKSRVAGEVLNLGVSIINDISGGLFDPDILNVVARFNAGYIIMHTSGHPKVMQNFVKYDNVITDIYDHLEKQSLKAVDAGIKKIIVDPGIGFGKTVEDNYSILNRIDDFKSLGYPILMGLSRKSFLGKSLHLAVNERDEATAISETIALMNGAKIIRTHNSILGKMIKDIYTFTNKNQYV